jgi:capsular exopolysaccharide synthesis family protein
MRKKRKNRSRNYEAKLITSSDPKSPISEAFRTIRTNIEFSSIDKQIKNILVTSTIPSEGKSTIAANLGVTMAAAGKRVLLIDADLRNPALGKYFNKSSHVGLTNLLLDDNLGWEEVMLSPGQENLYLLTSGPIPPNPAELIGSNKMRSFVAAVSESFDVVLVDAPPVLAVADASILANYLDGVILVVGTGDATHEQTLAAKEQLQKAKANILGVILNKAPMQEGYYYHYYYGSR